MKLSYRLTQIKAMVGSHYDHIWDCCCDHGYLGQALLACDAAPTVHFVDIVPELMQDLQRNLQALWPASRWQTHCLDVAQLPLESHPGRQLVILAGIGGDLVVDVVRRLHRQNPETEIDYLLCPVYHQFAVRKQLIALNFKLRAEALVEDRHRYYEILKVSPASDRTAHLPNVSPVGDALWQAATPEQFDVAKGYLQRTLNHYRRVLRGGTKDPANALDAYQAVYRRLKAE